MLATWVKTLNKDEKSQRISQWKYGYSINLVPRVLSYPPYGTLRRAGRREPRERGCYSMSSIFWPDPTIVLNPILETPKKKSFESKKSTLIYFRWIFLVFFCRTARILALLFVRYLRPNPGVDKTRNMETFWNIPEHEQIKIFSYEKKF